MKEEPRKEKGEGRERGKLEKEENPKFRNMTFLPVNTKNT